MDRYGAKALLLISFAASAAGYALTGAATSMAGLYVSRIPSLFQHAVLAARVVASLSTSEANRATTLAYIGVAYGVGAVLGPSVGGHVSALHGPQAASWIATAGSVVSMVTVILLLPSAPLFAAVCLAARFAVFDDTLPSTRTWTSWTMHGPSV